MRGAFRRSFRRRCWENFLCARGKRFFSSLTLYTHTHKYIFIPGSFVINVYDVSWKTFPTWKETIIALSLSLCFHALLTRGEGEGSLRPIRAKGKGLGEEERRRRRKKPLSKAPFDPFAILTVQGYLSLSLSLPPSLCSNIFFSKRKGERKGRESIDVTTRLV